MKFAIVFLISFAVAVLTSAQNSYQQCGGVAEQARIRQLESENQQLRNNNQAMAAAGGMMVGFLSGYAGSRNSNPKTTINVSTQSNELADTVKTLAENHQALAEQHEALVENYENLVESHQALSNTVKDLQEQMSQ